MKISQQLPVDNEYGACADMRRQGVTCRQENSFKKILVGRYVLLHKTKPSTCEDKVRLFYAIKLKFARNLKFATSKTLVNFMKKMMFLSKNWYFSVQKP